MGTQLFLLHAEFESRYDQGAFHPPSLLLTLVRRFSCTLHCPEIALGMVPLISARLLLETLTSLSTSLQFRGFLSQHVWFLCS